MYSHNVLASSFQAVINILCVGMYIYIYIIYIIYIYIYICIYIYVYVYICVHTYTCIYAYMYIHNVPASKLPDSHEHPLRWPAYRQ